MQRIGEHFGACNLQPKGSGSNKPRSQMHLQTCWVKFLPEIQTHRAAQPIWQKTRGQCMNFNVRWGGWKFIRALMRRVWWQNFWKIRLMISKQTYCICSIIFSTLEIFHHVGAGRFFRCWRRRRGRNNHQITGPLQTSVCCTKHLPSWFWVAHWRHRRLYSRNLAKAASTLEDEWAKVCSIFVPTLCIHSSCFPITQTFPTAVQTPVPSMGYQGQCATGLQVSLTHSLILGRIEALLEAHQPEEQHGFRQHRRMDEHLLTATLFLDKAWDKGIPVWIVSLDLSKAFDRVNWNALWLALRDHGVSDHLIWILQLIYSNQLGEVQGEHSNSSPFPIHAGVRQGCVLSPRLFCSVLQWGMSAWRQNAETRKCGFDLGDNMAFLLDLRFADDILLFARTAAEAMALLDDLVHKLQNIGLQLNTGKTVILTSEVQPPSFLHNGQWR